MNYCAAFLLRVFERKHLVLFDEWSNDSQNHEFFEKTVQKWTTQGLVKELGAIYRARGIPDAMKLLHSLGFIRHEYAMNGRSYKGHNILFFPSEVQKAIDENQRKTREMVETAMATNKVFEHPKRGRFKGSKNKPKA